MFFLDRIRLFNASGSMRYLEFVRYKGFPLEGLGKISKLAIDLFEELAKALAVERII
jgi:hypothetical protein